MDFFGGSVDIKWLNLMLRMEDLQLKVDEVLDDEQPPIAAAAAAQEPLQEVLPEDEERHEPPSQTGTSLGLQPFWSIYISIFKPIRLIPETRKIQCQW